MSNSVIYFGGYGTSFSFNGSLDEIMMFNRTLSQSEISALYNSQSNKFNATLTGLSLGQHNYNVYAVDAVGNFNSSGQRNFVVNDTTPPTITFEEPPTPANGSTVNSSTQTIVADISDDSTGNTSSWMDFDRSLVGYWAMDYYNETGIYDNSTWNNFGAFAAGTGLNYSNLTTGIRGKALSYDGLNDYTLIGWKSRFWYWRF
jgi:hypothetical protein